MDSSHRPGQFGPPFSGITKIQQNLFSGEGGIDFWQLYANQFHDKNSITCPILSPKNIPRSGDFFKTTFCALNRLNAITILQILILM